MKSNNYFPKHRPKLKLEAILRSVLCALAVGFGANFIAALVTWFTPVNGLWISLGVFAVVTLICIPIFYFKRFRPTDISSARRIDTLGLEERLVTMVEYRNDDSLIAELQRKDANAALERTSAKQLKITISTSIIITLAICAFLGLGMTTVNALGENGVLPGGDEIVNTIVEDQTTEYVTVSYVIEEGGIIEGDEDQIIVKGTNASTVTAVADDGYVFKEWDDGKPDPTRNDKEITEDVVYVAVFMPIGDGENGDNSEDGEGEEGEESDDAPSSDSSESGNQGNDSQPNQDNSGSGAGGKYEPNNQIIDGLKFYRDELDAKYRDDANDLIESEDSGLSEDEKDLIKKYFGIV